MASDSPGEGSVPPRLPPAVREWVGEVAGADDVSREELFEALLSAYREAGGESWDGLDDDADAAAELAAALHADVEATVEDRLSESAVGPDPEAIEEAVAQDLADRFVEADEFSTRLDGQESEFRTLLEDVRERVVQVKREADAKAAGDHDHPDLAERVAATADTLESVRTELDALAGQVDEGFENFETVAERLADAVDKLSARQQTLARALVETRDRVRTVAAGEAARSRADDLRRSANRHGVRVADCESCGEQVDLALLTRSTCPHCSTQFTGVDPGSWFLGSNTLETDAQPALEPADVDADGFEFDVEELADDDPLETEDRPEEGENS